MDSIGLRRHTVRLAEHRPVWARLFASEAALIRELAGEFLLDVQHIGSTAVPGLAAKPVLDLAAALRSPADRPAVVTILCANGYIDRGNGGDQGGYPLVKESKPGLRTVHLHLVEQIDPQWMQYLSFRNILRQDIALRDQYAALKQELAQRFPDDRRSYTEGKHEFITEVLGHPHVAGADAPEAER